MALRLWVMKFVFLVTLAFASGLMSAFWKPAGSPAHWFLALVCLLVCLVVTGIFVRSLWCQQQRLCSLVSRVSQGQLNASLSPKSHKGLLGVLADGLLGMKRSLNEILTGFFRSANEVYLSSVSLEKCAVSAEDNASLQSEKTQQVMTATEQMAATIRQIADNAGVVADMSNRSMEQTREEKKHADHAQASAEQVLNSTKLLTQSMQRLEKSSTEIGQVVTLINGIANQTNLLSLNASVEAARAGEHGKGFAVVAAEVKTLAQNTIAATAEIAAKVEHIQKECNATSVNLESTCQAVAQTGDDIGHLGAALHSMVDTFEQVHEKIMEISSAVQEQSATTNEVSGSMEQMAKLSEAMEGMVRQVRHEVQSLNSVTDELLLLLDRFRLEAHEKARAVVEQLAAKTDLAGTNRSRKENLLRQAVRQEPFFELLYITDRNGRQITSNILASAGSATSYQGDGYGMDWSKRPWFVGAQKSGNCYISELYRSAATGRFCFTVACLIKNEHGVVQGVLGADINILGLFDSFKAA